MNKLTNFGVLFLIGLTVGCTGTIVTKNLTPAEVSKTGAEFNGVISYSQSLFYETYQTTIRKDEKGNVIAWEVETDSNKKCTPITQRKIAIRTDYDHPRLISYDHGILEGYTFSVNLTGDGALQSVNSVAVPDRGQTLSNLSSVAVNAAMIPVASAVEFPPCNDGAVIIDIKPYDKSNP